MAYGSNRIESPNQILRRDTNRREETIPDRDAAAQESAAVIQQFCQANGQMLLPIVQLIESASQVVQNVIHEVQIQTLETIFMVSAEQIAGTRTPGKSSGEIRWHGSQKGRVKLADREVRVKRPRLRHKTEGEVKIPAYEKLRQDRGLEQHMLGALLRGISTREYDQVLPKMTETAGVSRSSVSRQAIEPSVEQLQALREKRWDSTEILVIYIDGQRFGGHHILSAVGVDSGDRVWRDRERRCGETPAHASARSGFANGPHLSVRHRRSQSAALGHRRSIRRGAAHPALQESQKCATCWTNCRKTHKARR